MNRYGFVHNGDPYVIESESDVAEMATSAIVALYNNVTGKKIKSFHTRDKGIARTWAAILAKPEEAAAPINGVQIAARPGRKPIHGDDMIIKLNCFANPKREGTLAHSQFALIKHGMTLGAYRALEGEQPDLDLRPGWPNMEIAWNVKKEYVIIVTPQEFRESVDARQNVAA